MNTLLHPAVLLRFDLICFRGFLIVILPELAERSLRLLGQIIDQAHEGIPDKLDFASPPEFIYLHARNIRALGKDVLALEAQTQSRGLANLGALDAESLFAHPMRGKLVSLRHVDHIMNASTSSGENVALVAAAKDPEFPAGKVIAEQKDQIRRIKMWIGENPRSEFQEKIEEASARSATLSRGAPNRKDGKWIMAPVSTASVRV
jgi:hypothetical protein